MTSVLLSTKEFSSHIHNNTAYCTWTHIYFTDTEIYVIQLKSLKWWHKTICVWFPTWWFQTAVDFTWFHFNVPKLTATLLPQKQLQKHFFVFIISLDEISWYFKKRLHSIPHSSLLYRPSSLLVPGASLSQG